MSLTAKKHTRTLKDDENVLILIVAVVIQTFALVKAPQSVHKNHHFIA